MYNASMFERDINYSLGITRRKSIKVAGDLPKEVQALLVNGGIWQGGSGGSVPEGIPDKAIQNWVDKIVDGVFKEAVQDYAMEEGLKYEDVDPLNVSENTFEDSAGIAEISRSKPKGKGFMHGEEVKKFKVSGVTLYVKAGIDGI